MLKLTSSKTWTKARIMGYRSQLIAAILMCEDGATVELDLTSAKAIADILASMQEGETNHATSA